MKQRVQNHRTDSEVMEYWGAAAQANIEANAARQRKSPAWKVTTVYGRKGGVPFESETGGSYFFEVDSDGPQRIVYQDPYEVVDYACMYAPQTIAMFVERGDWEVVEEIHHVPAEEMHAMDLAIVRECGFETVGELANAFNELAKDYEQVVLDHCDLMNETSAYIRNLRALAQTWVDR